jgi:molybdenum cofactor cytidylyltransferase
MGAQKLLLPLAGRTLLERALDAAAAYPTIVVVSPALAARVPPASPERRVVVNDAPERGMSHSLALAAALVDDPAAALVVLLADTPCVDGELVERMVAALGDNDVAYPLRDGVPGHPVVFGPRARKAIAELPDGDTLRALRDDPRFRRAAVALTSDAPFADVDTPEDYRRVTALAHPGDQTARP